MRTVQTDTERAALVPQTAGEAILQGTTLYVAIGMTAGAWKVASSLGVNGEAQLLRALGSSIKVMNCELLEVSGSVQTLVDAQVRFESIYVYSAHNINGVKWKQGVAGVFTADNNNRIGLYSYLAGTLTLVASTPDDGTTWKVTTGEFGSAAFSVPYLAQPGVYFIGIIYNNSAQTTAPVLGGSSNSSTLSNLDFTNSALLRGTLAAQTDIPTTQLMSGLTAAQNRVWFGLY